VVVTKDDIVAGLREFGLGAGAGLIVHSSLSSFGRVEGGPHTVIEALMEVLTPDGTLMMPSFNHGAAFREGGPGYYNPMETPTTNGAIPDAFWRRSDVYRSLDPTHPFAAWGKKAHEYIQHHHRTLTMGPDSPLGLLFKDDGSCLLVGVGYNANTFHHVVEMSLLAPCLGQRTEAYDVVLPDGRRVEGRTWGWRESKCPHNDTAPYAGEMEASGLHRKVQVANSWLTFFRLGDCYQVISENLLTGRDGFPPCSECPIRPRLVPCTVPSDWDKERQCLLPDSPAWSY